MHYWIVCLLGPADEAVLGGFVGWSWQLLVSTARKAVVPYPERTASFLVLGLQVLGSCLVKLLLSIKNLVFS